MPAEQKHISKNTQTLLSAKAASKRLKCAADYVTKLCRDGKLAGTQIDGAWFVSVGTVEAYKQAREEAKVTRSQKLSQERLAEQKHISKNTQTLLSAKAASKYLKCAADYVTKLCRDGKLAGEQVDGVWYVSAEVIDAYKQTREEAKKARSQKLSQERLGEQTVLQSVATRSPLKTYAALSLGVAFLFAAVVFAGSSGAALPFGPHTQTAAIAHVESPFFAGIPWSNTVQASGSGFFGSIFAFLFGSHSSQPQVAVSNSTSPEASKDTAPLVAAPVVKATSPVASKGTAAQTIIEQKTYPVTERTVIQTQSGLSQSDLDEQLAALSQNLKQYVLSQLANAPTSNSYGGGGTVTVNEALAQKIDQLSGVSITGGTIEGAHISGGTISNVTISAANLNDIVAIANGGTGTSTAPAQGQLLVGNATGGYDLLAPGSNGQVLQVFGGQLAWGFNAGGGGGGGAWATTTDNLALYPGIPTQVVLVGTTATTTNGTILEVNGNSLFRNQVTAYGAVTAPAFVATSSIASVFPFASTTALTVSGNGYFGSASTTNLTISGVSNALLKTLANGAVVAALAGTDYQAPGNYATFSYPFPGNATSTSIAFNGGITASSATVTNALFTNATSTNFAATGIASSTFLVVSSLGGSGTSCVQADASGHLTTTGSACSSGSVNTVTNSDGTLTVSPTTGNVVASLNLAHANIFTGLQQFAAGASTTALSAGIAYFGTAATSSFAADGTLTLAHALAIGSGGTGTSTAPTYGKVLVGNIFGGYDLVSTSSLGIVTGSGSSSGFPFTPTTFGATAANATSTLIGFTSGLYATASSTITTLTTDTLTLNNLTSGATGTTTLTGNLIPSANNAYTLGSPSNAFKEVYIGPGSLFVNGQEVLHTNGSDDVLVTASINQNLDLQTSGSANIELNPTGTGQVLIKSNINLTGGKSFNTSDNSAVLFPFGTQPGNISISGNSIAAANLNGGISLTPAGNGGVYVTAGNFGIGTTSPTNKLEVNGASYLGGNVLVTGNSLLQQATTTNLAITNTPSALLKTLANGAVVAALAGTDYQAPGNYATFSYPFPGNATSTSIAFNGGITASSATVTNALFTNATSTNFAATGIASSTFLVVSSLGGSGTSCVQADASGALSTTGTACGSGSGSVSSVSNSDGTLTISPTAGSVVASLNLAHVNTFSALQNFNGGATFAGATTTALTVNGSTTIAGVLNLGSALTVPNGGTGSTTLTGLLVGNGTSGLNSATVSAPLALSGSTLSITQSGLGSDGYLSSVDFTAFNNKISSTSLSATYPVQYSSGTGVFSLAFGTTTTNTWSALQTFSGGFIAAASSTVAGDFTVAGTATTTNLAIANLTSALLKTNALGQVVAAVPGSDYLTAATIFGYPFPNNATSTTLGFNGGFVSSASSTFSGSLNAGAVNLAGLSNAVLAVNASGQIIATSSINVSNLSGVLPVANGGTGSSTLAGILVGSSTLNQVRTLVVGSGLTFDGTTLATNGAGINAIGPLGQTQTGGTQLFATSTTGTDFTITASGNTQTFNLPFASLTSTGKLAAADFANFTNKISSSSLSGASVISYNSSTGVITTQGGTFGGGDYTFPGNVVVTSTMTSFGGAVFGGTATSSFSTNGALTLAQALAIGSGGTNNTSFSPNSILYFDGNKIAATSSTLYTGSLVATTSTATSTLSGGLAVANSLFVLQNGNIGIGNSTPSKTLDITGTARVSGVFTLSTNSSCTGGAALQTDVQGNVTCGTISFTGITNAGGWTTDSIGHVTLATSTDQVGIGATSTPYAKLAILSGGAGTTTLALLPASGATANILDIYNPSGVLTSVITAQNNFGIGTTSPSQVLSVQGNALLSGNLSAANVAATGTLTALGNVGIGTTSPSSLLTIAGGNITQVAAGNPSLATTVPEVGATHAFGTYVAGNYEYVADYEGGLRIFDISNPQKPTLVGSNSSYAGSPKARQVVVAGKYAYVADEGGGLYIFDVSKTNSPALVGNYAVSGSALSLALSGRYAFVTDSNNHATRIVDVSNPASPVLAGTFTSPSNIGPGSPVGVAVQGKYLYVADFAPALYIADISNPANPTLVGSYTGTSASSPESVYVSGRYAYVVDEDTGLYIVDIANPASPVRVGRYPTVGSAHYISVQVAGSYAYAVDHSGNVVVIDVSSPTTPSLIGTIASAGNPNSVFVAGTYAYVADNDQGVDTISLNGATLPAANIGALQSNTANIADNINVGGDIFAGGGLNVGFSGIFSRGGLSVLGSSTLGSTLTVNGQTSLLASTTITGGLTSLTANLFASTTLLGNSLFSFATTTNFAITGTANTLLKTLSNGAVVAAQAGSDYATPATVAAAFPFTPTTFGSTNANATSTLIGFTNGIYALASSTIGNGTQVGGLTISGGATTTGNAYFAGNVGIGTSSPTQLLALAGGGNDAAALFNSTIAGSLGTTASTSPSTAVDDASIGAAGWLTTTNAEVQDGSSAQLTGLRTSTSPSHYLDAEGFNISIPTNATVTGIVVAVVKGASAVGVIQDSSIKLIVGGTASGTDKADTVTNWSTGLATTTYGSSADTWGLSLTGADVDSGTFGVAFSAKANSIPNRTASVDYISVKVYYTVPTINQNFALGIDNSDAGSFKISGSTALGTSDFLTVTSAGSVGIGTSSPTTKFTVQGIAGSATILTVASSTGASLFSVSAAGNGSFAGSVNGTSYLLSGSAFLTASTTGFSTLAGLGQPTLTSGARNSSFGYQALSNATSSTDNTAVGYQALSGTQTDSSGGFNTAVGSRALSFNTSGNNNSAFGSLALQDNTSGNNNVANGYQALFNNSTGSSNIGVGFDTLEQNVSGVSNIAIGDSALLGVIVQSVNGNIAIGQSAGERAGTGADYNVFLGYQAGFNITSGSNNLILGSATSSNSISNLTTGSQNILIGNNISLPSATANGQLDIGNILYGTGITSTGSTLSTGNLGIGTTTPIAKLSVDTSNLAAGVPEFAIGSSTRTDLMIDQGGNVGIGTAAPANLLDIVQNVNAIVRARVLNTNSSANAASAFIADNGTNQLWLQQMGTGKSFGIASAGEAMLYSTSAGLSLISDNASGVIKFATGGNSSERARIDASGKFGIGTTSPSQALSVTGKVYTTGGVQFPDGTLQTSAAGAATITGTTGQVAYFQGTNSPIGTSSLFISTAGNVGVGTTTFPSSVQLPLYVTRDQNNATAIGVSNFNTGSVASAGYNFYIDTGAVAGGLFYTGSGNSSYGGASSLNLVNVRNAPLALGTNNTVQVTVTSAGNVGIGSTTPWGKLSVDTTSLAAGIPEFAIGSSTRTDFVVNQNGNVGIGTTSPSSIFKLDISGSYARIGSNGGDAAWASTDQTNSVFAGLLGSSGCGAGNWSVFASGCRLAVTQSGNVGIGTTNPARGALQINKLSTYNSEQSGAITVFTGTIGQPELTMGVDNANTVSYIQSLSSGTSFGTVPLALQPNGGNVGIGTTSPSSIFSIAASSPKLFVYDTTGGSAGLKGPAYADFNSASGDLLVGKEAGVGGTLMANSSSHAGLLDVTDANPLQFGTNNTTRVTIDANGLFGIGTTSPWARLSVDTTSLAAGVPEFAIGSSTRSDLTITQTGNVGLGVTAPSSRLNLADSSQIQIGIDDNSTGGNWLQIHRGSTAVPIGFTSGYIGYDFGINNNETLELTGREIQLTTSDKIVLSGGNVGIGTTSPASAANSILTVEKDQNSSSRIDVANYNSGSGAASGLGLSNDTGIGSALLFNSSGNTTYGGANSLNLIQVKNAPLALSTNNTVQLTVTGAGNVGIGAAGPVSLLSVGGNGDSGYEASITRQTGGAGTAGNLALIDPSTSGTQTAITFLQDGGTVGSITTNNTNAAYNTTSDRRLKENIATTTAGLDTLLSIPVEDFNFIKDPTKSKVQGFIAQDLYKYYPEAVSTNGDNGTVALGTSTPWQVDYGRLTPLIVQSVKDLANSSVRISNGVINLSAAPATTTIAVGYGTWNIATSSATGTMPIISISAPASSTPVVSINGSLYLNGQDITSVASTTATTTPAALVAGPLAAATDAFKQAVTAALTGLQNIAQLGVRNLGAAVYATVGTFTNVFTQHLVATDINADTITANQKFCIGTTCVTETQLQQLLNGGAGQAQAAGGSGSGSSGNSTSTPPTITINGVNPATVNIGDTYSDLGATAKDNQGTSLGVQTYVNGVFASTITIDTSSVATDTIDYVATDTWGNTATSTRTVIVAP